MRGFNLFEKPCPWLWTNLGEIGKIIENLNLIDMAAKGWINQRVIKVHFLEGDSRECLGGDKW